MAAYSLHAQPVPLPPDAEFMNDPAMCTIQAHLDLFKVVTPIKVDALEAMLTEHPNQPYVKSVLWSLQNGFWPWAKAVGDLDPDHWDNSERPPKNDEESVRPESSVESAKGKELDSNVGNYGTTGTIYILMY